ncbi:hypothetical protein ACEQ8H_000493 [Pleosporales sp. CAS-2024a]
MCQNMDARSAAVRGAPRPRLTEENLRMHSAVHHKTSNQMDYGYDAVDCDVDESEDGELLAMHDTALRKAASLEALQAYGGCFVSGFLAMQEPLPWMASPTATSTSRSSSTSTGSPRPDSDTLSRADLGQLGARLKSNLRSIKGLRSMARKARS